MQPSGTTESFTPKEIARALRVSPRTVRDLIARGQLRAWNIGSGPERPVYRVTPEALTAFIEARTIDSEPRS